MKKFDLVIVDLDPTKGSEINKTRPCLIISPDEMNASLRTVIIVPLTSTRPRTLPTRIKISPSDRNHLANISYAVLDQIKTIDKSRISGHLGVISEQEKQQITDTLLEMFDF